MVASRKRSTMLAVEKVEGNEELLTAILVRLPPKSVFSCRCVSKRWKSIIADPFFLQSYSTRIKDRQLSYRTCGRLLGFIREYYTGFGVNARRINILPVAHINDYKFKQVPDRFGRFLHYSNGIILCGFWNTCDFRYDCHVVNPVTGSSVSLPPSNIREAAAVGISCVENTSELLLSFKVVRAIRELVGKNTLMIETYSSKIGNWTNSKLIATGDISKLGELLLVKNSVFHWDALPLKLALYDSNGNDNHLQLIEKPYPESNIWSNFNITRSCSDDVLWYSVVVRDPVTFWMLPRHEIDSYKRATTIPKNEWRLMYTISYYSIRNDTALLLTNVKRKKWFTHALADNKIFWLMALIPGNPVVAILRLDDRVIAYDVGSKTIEFIRYRGRPIGKSPSLIWTPYLESLSLSSYAFPGSADF